MPSRMTEIPCAHHYSCRQVPTAERTVICRYRKCTVLERKPTSSFFRGVKRGGARSWRMEGISDCPGLLVRRGEIGTVNPLADQRRIGLGLHEILLRRLFPRRGKGQGSPGGKGSDAENKIRASLLLGLLRSDGGILGEPIAGSRISWTSRRRPGRSPEPP